jgi:hypothetical protein
MLLFDSLFWAHERNKNYFLDTMAFGFTFNDHSYSIMFPFLVLSYFREGISYFLKWLVYGLNSSFLNGLYYKVKESRN